MKLILVILVIFVPDGFSSIQQAKEAAIKAKDYLESQRDPVDGVWPLGEGAAASLGLLAMRPYRYKDLSSSVQGKQRLQIETLGISKEFLHTIRGILLNHGNMSNPLIHVDDTALLEFMGSLNGLCVDPKNYFGYNLVKECARRLRSTRTFMYGGMALALCNAGRDITEEQIRDLVNIRRCPTCPFRVEEVSMNLLAAICIEDRHKRGSTKGTIAREGVIPALVDKIVERQDPSDGGFGGFMATALAVQSLQRVQSNLIQESVTSRGLRKLLEYQKTDGSFGDSIAFTALAMPALTGQTVADLRKVDCVKRDTGHHIVSFVIVIGDFAHSMQRVRGHIKVRDGTRLINALSKYSRENPHTFRLRLTRVQGRVRIKSLNGLDTTSNNRWLIYRIEPDGSSENITKDLSDIRVTEDSTYEIKLAYIEF